MSPVNDYQVTFTVTGVKHTDTGTSLSLAYKEATEQDARCGFLLGWLGKSKSDDFVEYHPLHLRGYNPYKPGDKLRMVISKVEDEQG